MLVSELGELVGLLDGLYDGDEKLLLELLLNEPLLSELVLELLRLGISLGLPEKLVTVEVREKTCIACSLSSLGAMC